MRDWLRRTGRRLRQEPPKRALRASGHEVVAGTAGRLASAVHRRRRDPTPVWDRDWDVLVLLDGCRLDLFQAVADADDCEVLPDASAVDALWSVGSQSAEWMARTFDARYATEMARTAYVTGNPFSAQSGDQVPGVETAALPLRQRDFGWLHEAWRTAWTDGEISTIPPEPLTEAAIAAWRRREALAVDRVVVHYMQPHTPFRSRPRWFLGSADTQGWGSLTDEDGDEEELPVDDLDAEDRAFLEALDADDAVGRDPWTRLRDGELPADEFRAAYRDNLEWVLSDVARLVENCDGRVAVTSDHGNAAGEWGVWSHPPGVHLPALREVPWVELAGTDRRTVEPGLPEAATAASAGGEADADHLAHLGYR